MLFFKAAGVKSALVLDTILGREKVRSVSVLVFWKKYGTSSEAGEKTGQQQEWFKASVRGVYFGSVTNNISFYAESDLFHLLT